MPQHTIYIVDDDDALRASLDSVLRSDGFCVKTFDSGTTFLQTSLPDEPGCLVLDLWLPGMTGFDLQEQLARRDVYLPVIFISGYAEVPESVRALKSGAQDFLIKPFRYRQLRDAIDRALEADRLGRKQRSAIRALRERYSSLSARERQIFALVVSGRLNKQIAGELGTKEITVKQQRGGLMRKMRADSLPDLVRMAETLEITSPEDSTSLDPS
ncbi:MAG: response regulator transcription factor [Acidobacteriaceae bacterium]|nr:response regulator transcription factor [Acidobacteriaceae bacterium]